MSEALIKVTQLKAQIAGKWLLNGLNLKVHRGEILAVAGNSGCGKTNLLRHILLLEKSLTGSSIRVFGVELTTATLNEVRAVQQRWGVMFQHSALFSSLTVLENVMFPLRELTTLPKPLIQELAMLKIKLAGLQTEAAAKYPSQLSGGMKKRAALARALALDPELLFLDEPTSGLDPHSAGALDDLILHLRETLGMTVVLITHDLDSLWHMTDRVAFLAEGRILTTLPMQALSQYDHPIIREYFSGSRARQTDGI